MFLKEKCRHMLVIVISSGNRNDGCDGNGDCNYNGSSDFKMMVGF